MYSGHPSTTQKHTELNSTTIYFKVVNITKNRTYSCQCNCSPTLDPCGLDIFTGCEYEEKHVSETLISLQTVLMHILMEDLRLLYFK